MYAVIGLGKTGLSIAQFLHAQGIAFWLADTRDNPPELKHFQQQFSDIELVLGDIPQDKILSSTCVVVSPGLSRQHPILQQAIQANIPVIGDIELFARYAKAPIIAITGTNAKGTVTTMTAAILEAAGKQVYMGGNIGIPALDLLSKPVPDFYVMELSSFQLESTYSLKPVAATILNITDDHLDYHGTLEAYAEAKHRIYLAADNIIYNREDIMTTPRHVSAKTWSFGLSAAQDNNSFGIEQKDGHYYLMFGQQEILSVDELQVFGKHNWANALAACALAISVGMPLHALQQGLKNFHGLHHRCEKVLSKNDVTWIDDSKGTNVGATQAALLGIGPTIKGKIILIAGGLGKGQDFSLLKPLCERYVKVAILLGKDAPILAETLQGATQIKRVELLTQAVAYAKERAQAGDVVLLSPACSSLDMFKNYEERGQQFAAEVKKICA